MARLIHLSLLTLATMLFQVSGWGQSFNATISGSVTDPSGAVVPDAELTLTDMATSATAKFSTSPDGLFRFPNLQRGTYELKVSAKGFRDFVQRGIAVSINQSVRVDVKLVLGAEAQTIEVTAGASPLNFENAEVKGAVTPDTIKELPLLVGGATRSATDFVLLLPGVSTGSGGGSNRMVARFSGGMVFGDEAVLDGVTMQEGLLSQTGMIAFEDYPVSPDAVSEVSVLTSNYEPQYGSTTSAVITAVTKAGTNEFHGAGYWYHRNDALNARPYGAVSRPIDKEHDFGSFVGGPIKVRPFWGGRKKTYFFFNYEGMRSRGAPVSPVLTVPTLKMRNGDFSEWPYPIYDPDTLRPNPAFDSSQSVSSSNLPYLRDQFMGCDGKTPNLICSADPRFANSLAHKWLQYIPEPNRTALENNYEVNLPSAGHGLGYGNTNAYVARVDHYFGEKDHVFGTFHYRGIVKYLVSDLPAQIANNSIRDPNYNIIWRINWDHTFTPTLLNHMAYGFYDLKTGVYNISDGYVSAVPAIEGVANNNHQPAIRFASAPGFTGGGGYTGYGGNDDFLTTRPTRVINDLLTWVRGRHTFKFGAEYRNFAYPERVERNGSGTFFFSNASTGLTGINSGNSFASFLLEKVYTGNVDFRALPKWSPEAISFNAHFGDTWKATPKLSINYGIRWDFNPPSVEDQDQFSFFDPLGTNPGAGGRRGRLAFAGDKWGEASFGRRHPEEKYYKAFAPRLGVAYSLTPKTVIRAGYGIFFTQMYYPGWEGGISTDGFNANVAFSSQLGGLQPAFVLSGGFPQNFQRPPFIDSTFLNGKSTAGANNGFGNYRPFDANRLPYAQQWNLTVEHQFTNDFYVSTAYVGNKGTRLPSTLAPLNALDPRLLSTGQQLFDQFQPGQTELNGMPIPYAGWVEQMQACPPTMAQAMLPYPQYCGNIYGLNENAGNSTYHSFQLKAEKRFSGGIWVLTSYTISKILSSADNMNPGALLWSGLYGTISPFDRKRNKSLGLDDVPQILSAALIYQLPFGSGKRFASKAGVVDKLVGGWQISSIFRASGGTPFFFRSSNCNVPAQFAAGCIPAISPGASPFAQDKGNFEPTKPLFNRAAFENSDSAGFQFALGHGPRMSNVRGFGFHDHSLGLVKNTRIKEGLNFQIRAEFFNLWNWHVFAGNAGYGNNDFNTDIASPTFGMWNGVASPPRNIQVGARIEF